jgi:hypothetical protein
MKIAWTAMMAFGAAALCGCVERDITINTEPQGALVMVSEREVGRTPVTIPFTWYGDYDIILRHEGSQTLKTHAMILPPWYEIPPVDLLSYCAPWTYYDHRYLTYKLQKLELPSDQELIRQADKMRDRTDEGPGPRAP